MPSFIALDVSSANAAELIALPTKQILFGGSTYLMLGIGVLESGTYSGAACIALYPESQSFERYAVIREVKMRRRSIELREEWLPNAAPVGAGLLGHVGRKGGNGWKCWSSLPRGTVVRVDWRG